MTISPPASSGALEEGGNEATEGTRLLLPSANSTEQPSSANLSGQKYGDEDSTTTPLMEVQLASMPPPKNMESGSSDGDFDGKRYPTKTMATRLRWAGSIILILLALFLIHRSFNKSHTSTEPSHRHGQHPAVSSATVPFSTLDPVKDLGLYKYKRQADTSAPLIFREAKKAYPTNAWYQNMLLSREEPNMAHRAYAVPYLLDAVGPIPGLRVHPNHIDATQTLVQLTFVEQHALTMGATPALGSKAIISSTQSYSVVKTTPLAITLEWNAHPMKSNIVRGMPYATMHYEAIRNVDEVGQVFYPTLASESSMSTSPIIDGRASTMNCSLSNSGKRLVHHEMEISYTESDFTWLVFFSRPVWVQCGKDKDKRTMLQVIDLEETDDSASANESPLIVRIALLDFCTVGLNPITCRDPNTKGAPGKVDEFRKVLKANANIYPGENTFVDFDVQDEEDTATLTFHWDPRYMRNSLSQDENADLITFALPHQLDKFNISTVTTADKQHCRQSLIGWACLIKGANWTIEENLLITSLRAPRPPTPESLGGIAAALKDDISYDIPDYYQSGIGDTYFSGKMLAKLGRIIVIADEVQSICNKPSQSYRAACANVTLPSKHAIDDALDLLRSGTEIWINGSAGTPFVYDTGWGGMCSCGCLFDHGQCNNKFPDCPAFYDPGLNFGNGFYNDMHFHYGYLIYSAAIVAHFDPAWGREHYEQVLLLIRNIANPSEADIYFTVFRQKDWFMGSSWASGVAMPPNLNGKNQESSSEAIAAYEAIALFGTVMISAWQETKSASKVATAKEVRKVGRLLTVTEVRSTKRYWHVRREESARVYPEEYAPRVIGMMWSTSIQFQTWFGLSPFLAYGIQLLPLTAISEDRDSLDWAKEMYEPFADSCNQDSVCSNFGWSVLQLAMLATVGHRDLAATKTWELDADVFTSAGGNGHSRTNTLWYIATRPDVVNPIPVPKSDIAASKKHNEPTPPDAAENLDCGMPDTCNDDELNTVASGSTCRERIMWLIDTLQQSQQDACSQVAGDEFPTECGGCDPNGGTTSAVDEEAAKRCPPCDEKECTSQLNRCPYFRHTFVCTDGPSTGGCLGTPWELNGVDCLGCCELTQCQKEKLPMAAAKTHGSPDCPRCSKDVCQSRLNMCPVTTAPYLCVGGAGSGGCAPDPWKISSVDCDECCEVTADCHK